MEMLSPIEGLTPPQREVVDRGLLASGGAVLNLATGSGKTWLAERAMLESVGWGYRSVYVAPTRALADECYERWKRMHPGVAVGVYTGERTAGGRRPQLSYSRAQVLVMTPERLDACTRHWRSHWTWIPEVDRLVVDEVHLLNDDVRGARLEGCLSRFRRLNPFARVIALSATVGNADELAGWLGGEAVVSGWRPVPLRWRRVPYKRADEKPALLRETVGETVRSGGRSLVFVQSRRRAEELAAELRTEGVRALHHHGALGREVRAEVEAGVRDGEADVVVATSTLEVGLNLPVRQVVLYDVQRFDGSRFAPLDVSAVWQRAGRAGRPGFDREGEVVLFEPAWVTGPDYEAGAFEPVESGLCRSAALAEQVVVEVSSGTSRTREQLARAFSGAFAGYQGRLPEVGSVVDEMVGAGLLTVDRECTG